MSGQRLPGPGESYEVIKVWKESYDYGLDHECYSLVSGADRGG
jgi:hypothetical protein